MTLTAIDCHGFGGGFTLGTAQAGFELVAKKGREVGFGVLNVLANRHLIPGDWEVESGEPSRWVPQPANFVFGNPPCSGFSTLSPKHFRGESSTINDCMWEVIRYAGQVAPEVVAFESVQQAFTQGRKLMQALHAELEEISGEEYTLVHVLHNNAGLGGCSIRRRYFWTAVKRGTTFGVEDCATRYDFRNKRLEVYTLDAVPDFDEVLRDLVPLNLTMERQPYRGVIHVPCPTPCRDPKCDAICHEVHVAARQRVHKPETCPSLWVDTITASWWTHMHMHDGSGTVDGHDVFRSPTYDRIREMIYLAERDGDKWRQNERMADVMRRYYERHDELPESWRYMSKKPYDPPRYIEEKGKIKQLFIPIRKDHRLKETDFAMGHNQPFRWRGDRMARVITGGAVHLVVHPTEDRTLTHREAARIQGFPDAWHIWPVRNAADLGPGWGKGVPVHAGRWIAHWASESIQGRPGDIQGEADDLSGERELVIDVTNSYRRFADKLETRLDQGVHETC